MFRDWREEHLIPGPRAKGRRRGQAPEQDYPLLTYRQALRICRLKRSGVEHRWQWVIYLWLEQGCVEGQQLRDALRRELVYIRRRTRTLADSAIVSELQPENISQLPKQIRDRFPTTALAAHGLEIPAAFHAEALRFLFVEGQYLPYEQLQRLQRILFPNIPAKFFDESSAAIFQSGAFDELAESFGDDTSIDDLTIARELLWLSDEYLMVIRNHLSGLGLSVEHKRLAIAALDQSLYPFGNWLRILRFLLMVHTVRTDISRGKPTYRILREHQTGLEEYKELRKVYQDTESMGRYIRARLGELWNT